MPLDRKSLRLFWYVWAGVGLLSSLEAGELNDNDFSLRFPAALSRVANYGDVAGLGGASAASPWTSSANPSSLCWTDVAGPLHTYNAVQYNRIDFENGSTFQMGAVAFVWQTQGSGTWALGLAQAESNEKTLNTGIALNFETFLLDVSWGGHLSEQTAVGAGLRWTEAAVNNTFEGMPVADADSPGYLFRLGLLHQPATNLLVGTTLEAGRSKDTAKMVNLLSETPLFFSIDDPMDQLYVRSGVHWTYYKESALYADLHYAHFENSLGDLDLWRLASGIEQQIGPGTFARVGAMQDLTWQQFSWTLGLGIYPNDRISLDVAWQHNFFPEIKNEFGDADTWALSFSVSL